MAKTAPFAKSSSSERATSSADGHHLTAGLSIESEYRPVREVSGDYFQIIPHAADGSTLTVAEDVTGTECVG
jgi:hypothetical protein